jgi:PAP2 superfamily
MPMATWPLTASETERSTPPPALGRPHGRLVSGLAPVLLLYVLYSAVRFLVSERGPDVGFVNARRLLDLEERIGIAGERAAQAALLPHHWIVIGSNWYYVIGFLPVLIAGALLSAWRAGEAFRRWRSIFSVSLLIALAGYAFFPLAPPRMLPASMGFVDTMQLYGPRYYGDASGDSLFNGYGSLPSTVNVYAAMPSMHVAWSVVAGVLLAAAYGNRRWVVVAAVVHPVLMAFAVIVTANHYILDVVAGLLVLWLAMAIASTYERKVLRR